MSGDVPAGYVRATSGELPRAGVDEGRTSLVCFRCGESLAPITVTRDGRIADPVFDSRWSLMGSAWQIVDPEVRDALSDPLLAPLLEQMRRLQEREMAHRAPSEDPSPALVVCPGCRHVQTIPSRVQS